MPRLFDRDVARAAFTRAGRLSASLGGGVADAVWRRERRGRVLRYGPFYRSGYLDALVAGRLEDGGDFALVAGSHARNFPYYHPRSRWDDLLLLAGGEPLLVAGRRVSTLNLALGPGGRAVVGYHGRARTRTGSAAELDLNLELRARVFPRRGEGLGIGPAVVGLQWQPALVEGGGSLTVDGSRREIRGAAGLVERGSLVHVRGRAFELAFHYLAVAAPSDGPAVWVRFGASPLRGGVAALPLRFLLARGIAGEDTTLAGDGGRPGDVLGLAPRPGEAVEPVSEHRVDVGPAVIHRQLVRIGVGAERRYGLNQRADAKGAPG